MAGVIRNFSWLVRYLADQNVSGWKKLLFFLPLIYFLSPIDLFPDIIFPFGYLEDVGVLLFGWQMIKNELEKYKQSMFDKKDKDNVVNLNKDDYKVK
ncbi:hypothetical protein BBF96_05660 [Anoxybacter fermentans]|uniref:DUF1232 domain-containing protein n=1 Tax=Anoxybacter fermentans TaxID=1323375 RepID=A0A3S9SXE8_9FIRM|nr:DUF1232 domain-containing protein [Anoxybacter fermentans]AZR72922.1 hypothetical protein BBF96_05660 [Anoxybacter fermentans]